jgi:hypothetical protein
MDNNKEQYKRFVAETTHLIEAIKQETEKEHISEWYIKEKCSLLKMQIILLQACFEK